MDHKPWRWRRKSTEKTIDANATRTSLSLERIFVEDRDSDAESLKCPSNLSDRLPSVICDCSIKEELIRKHRRIAEQALAGQEMERAEAAYLKEELNKALQQEEIAEKKLAHLNAALKECSKEIESIREQHEERVQTAISNAKLDCDTEMKRLEAKLTEANKRISNLAAENANLMKALICKERLLRDLDTGKDELESELGIVTGRLESVEKENVFLKYEFRAMEKELEVWNEERKSGRRFSVEHARQINQLEAECQQLRHLVRKKLNPMVSDKSANGTSYLIERVYSLEEENAALREILAVSDSELQSWRIKYGQMGSRLAELEAQIQELSAGENSMQLAISGLELGGDSETWASALLAEYKDISVSNELFPVPEENTVNFRQHTSWLDEILKVILDEHRVSNRNLGDLLKDIKIALGHNGNYISEPKEESCSEICGLLTWEGSESLQGMPSKRSSVDEKRVLEVKDLSFAKEKIRKHFGFERSKSDIGLQIDSSDRHNTLAQMIVIQSTLQDENRRMKEKLRRVAEEKVVLRTEVQELKNKVESLQKEMESFKDSKGLMEDQVENQRLINEDLNTQLTVTKAKLNENLHKLSSLEVELDHRNNCCDELESTCLELQLQLETVSRKESPNTFMDAVAKQLFEQARCPVTALVVEDKKSLKLQGYSLRDRMMEEEFDEKDADKNTEEKSIVAYTGATPLPAPKPKASSPEHAGTLAVVSSKPSSGGFGFIRKLFLRRKKGSTKMKAIALQRNTSTALMKQRDVLLVA
ncbi:uncharacterized protein LOC141648409 [Silene latifolia]|uniref:uncharacterized protein LOC141648409 n=1 Tax=Silene latifolia TaxID=37657 RepID=UPI003D784335